MNLNNSKKLYRKIGVQNMYLHVMYKILEIHINKTSLKRCLLENLNKKLFFVFNELFLYIYIYNIFNNIISSI